MWVPYTPESYMNWGIIFLLECHVTSQHQNREYVNVLFNYCNISLKKKGRVSAEKNIYESLIYN